MDSSENFFDDDQDLGFHVQHYPWKELFPLMPHWEKESVSSVIQDATAILSTLGALAAKDFAPLGDEVSEQHPTLNKGVVTQAPLIKQISSKLAELGAMSATVSPEWGGMGMPLMVGHATLHMLARVDIPTSNVFAYFLGGLKVLETFEGIHDFGETITKVAMGQELGAMALTEPQAGSDLSQIRTRATKKLDGFWEISGQKIWITCGHAEHHFVLARSKSEKEVPGLQGLSLFYVPAFLPDGTKNIEVAGLEKKIGHHPIVTASINYNASRGTLLGKEGEGFSLMLHLMNHARVATASMALGACEHVYRVAKNYAQQRVTMGQPIAEHPMIADYLLDMQTTTQGLRALLFECVFHEDMEFRLRLKLKTASEDEKADLNKRLNHHYWQARLLTPLVKYFGSEESVRLSRIAIQILGGVGYMKEYGLGRFHTDTLLLPIYEGTSQIQSLMVLKDRLKYVFRSPRKFVQDLAKVQYGLLSELDPLQRKLLKMRHVYIQFLQAFILDALSDQMKTMAQSSFKNLSIAWKNNWDPKQSLNLGLKHAERFTKVVCYLSTAEILLKRIEQATTAEDKQLRKDIAENFMNFYEVRCQNALEELKSDSKNSKTKTRFVPKIFTQASSKLRSPMRQME